MTRSTPSPWVRHLYLAAGLLCLALAVAGILLPVLPTTPFLLLAAACFARSSNRLHAWLLGHPRFGPLLANWERHGAIRASAKRTATLAIVASAGLTLALAPMPRISKVALVATLAGVLTFIWTRPDGPAAP